MTNWIVIAATLLVGVWLLETVLFVLSYRTSRRPPESATESESPLG